MAEDRMDPLSTFLSTAAMQLLDARNDTRKQLAHAVPALLSVLAEPRVARTPAGEVLSRLLAWIEMDQRKGAATSGIVKCGWLRKISNKGLTTYRRWVVLDGTTLTYYADRSETELKGVLQLKGAAVAPHRSSMFQFNFGSSGWAFEVAPAPLSGSLESTSITRIRTVADLKRAATHAAMYGMDALAGGGREEGRLGSDAGVGHGRRTASMDMASPVAATSTTASTLVAAMTPPSSDKASLVAAGPLPASPRFAWWRSSGSGSSHKRVATGATPTKQGVGAMVGDDGSPEVGAHAGAARPSSAGNNGSGGGGGMPTPGSPISTLTAVSGSSGRDRLRRTSTYAAAMDSSSIVGSDGKALPPVTTALNPLHTTKKLYVWVCDSQQERDAWIAALQRAIEEASFEAEGLAWSRRFSTAHSRREYKAALASLAALATPLMMKADWVRVHMVAAQRNRGSGGATSSGSGGRARAGSGEGGGGERFDLKPLVPMPAESGSGFTSTDGSSGGGKLPSRRTSTGLDEPACTISVEDARLAVASPVNKKLAHVLAKREDRARRMMQGPLTTTPGGFGLGLLGGGDGGHPRQDALAEEMEVLRKDAFSAVASAQASAVRRRAGMTPGDRVNMRQLDKDAQRDVIVVGRLEVPSSDVHQLMAMVARSLVDTLNAVYTIIWRWRQAAEVVGSPSLQPPRDPPPSHLLALGRPVNGSGGLTANPRGFESAMVEFVREVMLCSSRTIVGGDIYDAIDLVFANPDHVLLKVDTDARTDPLRFVSVVGDILSLSTEADEVGGDTLSPPRTPAGTGPIPLYAVGVEEDTPHAAIATDATTVAMATGGAGPAGLGVGACSGDVLTLESSMDDDGVEEEDVVFSDAEDDAEEVGGAGVEAGAGRKGLPRPPSSFAPGGVAGLGASGADAPSPSPSFQVPTYTVSLVDDGSSTGPAGAAVEGRPDQPCTRPSLSPSTAVATTLPPLKHGPSVPVDSTSRRLDAVDDVVAGVTMGEVVGGGGGVLPEAMLQRMARGILRTLQPAGGSGSPGATSSADRVAHGIRTAASLLPYLHLHVHAGMRYVALMLEDAVDDETMLDAMLMDPSLSTQGGGGGRAGEVNHVTIVGEYARDFGWDTPAPSATVRVRMLPIDHTPPAGGSSRWSDDQGGTTSFGSSMDAHTATGSHGDDAVHMASPMLAP